MPTRGSARQPRLRRPSRPPPQVECDASALPDAPGACNSDQRLFKGILARGLSQLVARLRLRLRLRLATPPSGRSGASNWCAGQRALCEKKAASYSQLLRRNADWVWRHAQGARREGVFRGSWVGATANDSANGSGNGSATVTTFEVVAQSAAAHLFNAALLASLANRTAAPGEAA